MSDPAEVVRERLLKDATHLRLSHDWGTSKHDEALAALDTLIAERDRLQMDLDEHSELLAEALAESAEWKRLWQKVSMGVFDLQAERDTLRQEVADLEGERDEANSNCWDALQTLLEYQGDIQALTVERDTLRQEVEHWKAWRDGVAEDERWLAATALEGERDDYKEEQRESSRNGNHGGPR